MWATLLCDFGGGQGTCLHLNSLSFIFSLQTPLYTSNLIQPTSCTSVKADRVEVI